MDSQEPEPGARFGQRPLTTRFGKVPLSRRRFIGGTAAAVAAGALGPPFLGGTPAAAATPNAALRPTSAWAPAEAEYAPALRALGRTTLRHPGSLPSPHLAAGTDTLPGIEHVVVLMMENHSFDNIFGMLGRGDGLTLGANGLPTATNPYPDGKVQHAFRMPTTCQLSGTPSQEWLAAHTAYDNGKNDGFVRAPISVTDATIVGGVAMGYWTGDDLPFTDSLAKTFPIGDRWFCSLLGQTFPNRRYLIAGTSAGMTDDGGLSALLIPVPAPRGTVFNLLDNHGISWENYVSGYPTGATPELYLANDAIPELFHHKSLDDFVTDAANGALPSFSFLDPDYDTQSQENPQNWPRWCTRSARRPGGPRRSCSSCTTSTAATTTTCRRRPRSRPTASRRWSSRASAPTTASPATASASRRSSSPPSRSPTTSATCSTTTPRCWHSSSASGTCPRSPTATPTPTT
jgi:phospholipase C